MDAAAAARAGYGRAVVAGALQIAQGEGKRKAILFTDKGNPAERAYLAIGFKPIGDYGIVVFNRDVRGKISS